MQNPLLNWRVSVAGFLSWAIPFFGSFVFFDPNQGLMIPVIVFKSIMIVIGTLAGTALLVWVFRFVRPTLMSGIAIGIYWLILNWGLDIIVLVPMSGESVGTWFVETGMRYLSIAIIAIGMGLVASQKT